MDGLLELSLFHKRHGGNPDPDGWIYDLIVSRLKMPDESPAGRGCGMARGGTRPDRDGLCRDSGRSLKRQSLLFADKLNQMFGLIEIFLVFKIIETCSQFFKRLFIIFYL